MNPAANADLFLTDITTMDFISFVVYASPGQSQPLSGWHATAKVRSVLASATVIVELSDPTSVTVSSDSSGVVTVFFTSVTKATIMAALGSGIQGVWGLQMTDTSGNVWPLLPEAIMCVTESVPR